MSEKAQISLKTYLYLLDNTCSKAAINQITYLTLHLRIVQKNPTENSTFLQTMVIC